MRTFSVDQGNYNVIREVKQFVIRASWSSQNIFDVTKDWSCTDTLSESGRGQMGGGGVKVMLLFPLNDCVGIKCLTSFAGNDEEFG